MKGRPQGDAFSRKTTPSDTDISFSDALTDCGGATAIAPPHNAVPEATRWEDCAAFEPSAHEVAEYEDGHQSRRR